ncbi:hypothetical protein EJ04DRAFT_573770 [Polyplosphaeria fusca]|uniref:Uncharacterized protein n=1 Tax=Polyplosphaeria fusca TaxID=682080 RepID=A0A9P4R815_9PLEO|nr:hypothetical protein EJ04DRAFT_573770 [Polyplosphaeria fusca]
MREDWKALQWPMHETPTKSRVKVESDFPESFDTSLSATPASRKIKQESGVPPASFRSRLSSTPGFGKVKKEPKEDTPSPYVSLDTFSGVYKIDCPAIAEQFYEDGTTSLRLSLLQDFHRGVWWVELSWTSWRTLFLMNPGPVMLNKSCSLGWRMREDSGELKFGRRCTGNITFNSDGTLQGALFNAFFADNTI